MIKKRMICAAALAACLLLITIFLSARPADGERIVKTGFYFNTAVSLTANGKQNEKILEDAMALCEHYEKMLSRTAEGSDIWKINHAKGQPVSVQEDTAMLLSRAKEYAALSGGRIDPTIAPLSKLWNFTGNPPGPVPKGAEIERLLVHVSYESLKIDGTQVTLADPEAEIDTGFIAKGFIADRLKEFFLQNGVKNALINLGGNVLAVGGKPDGSPFVAGIQKPFGDRGETVRTVRLSDKSLVSSGNYERYFEQDGKRYHHILDTSTGYPASSGLLGVTILSASSLEGDALSTLCFLLGLEDGMALIEALPDVEALFITDDFSVYTTGAFPD